MSEAKQSILARLPKDLIGEIKKYTTTTVCNMILWYSHNTTGDETSVSFKITGDGSTVAITKACRVSPINIVMPNDKELLYKFVMTYLNGADTVGEVWVLFHTEDIKNDDIPLSFDIKYDPETNRNHHAILKNCVAMFGSISV